MLKSNDLVKFKDEPHGDPFLVHDIVKNKKLVSLGLREYPDTEQDHYFDWSAVTKLKGKELREGRRLIMKLM